MYFLQLSSLLLWFAYGLADARSYVNASKRIQSLRSDVVHCFSDAIDDLYKRYEQCPPESFEHKGRCRDAYIDHYKEMVIEELAAQEHHKDSALTAHLSKNLMSKIMPLHQIPRKNAVCVDFNERCYCKWLSLDRSMCPQLKVRNVLIAGDSMLRRQLTEVETICPKQKAMYRLVPGGYFNPAFPPHFHAMKNELRNNSNIEVFYVGFGMHSINIADKEDEYYTDLWMHYESYIEKTIQAVKELRPDIQIVWFIPNTIITARWYGEFRAHVNAILMNNFKKDVKKEIRNVVLSDDAEDADHHNDMWEYFVSRSFTRRSIVALARRSERVIQTKFPDVQIISGLRITDFMERYTDPHDGRHFNPFLRLKVSILLTLNAKRLLRSA